MPTTLSRPLPLKRAQVRVIQRRAQDHNLFQRLQREDFDVQVAEFEDVSQLEDVARIGGGTSENVTFWVFDLAKEDAAQSAPSLSRWMQQSSIEPLQGYLYQQLYALVLMSKEGSWQDIVSSLDPLLRAGHADFVRLEENASAQSWEEVMARLNLLMERQNFVQVKDKNQAPSPADEFAAKTLAPFPARAKVLPDLHDPQSGRLDAKRIAVFLGMTSASLARQLGTSPQALAKTPDASSLQPRLAPFHFVAVSLLDLVGTPEAARAWLNVPSDEFDGDTPLHLLQNGEVEVVTGLLRDALVGQPG